MKFINNYVTQVIYKKIIMIYTWVGNSVHYKMFFDKIHFIFNIYFKQYDYLW
jgi:hypothetical protein